MRQGTTGTLHGELIRVRGTVQGVGFRPMVWRVARHCGIRGSVRNDADGVLICAWGSAEALDRLVLLLQEQCPPLARIEGIERTAQATQDVPEGFLILASGEGPTQTGVVPDAATCPQCLAEVLDPADRRYRYPFTNCTHCGPRHSIIRAVPYDRGNTTMAAFAMCPACRREYGDPNDRRFHAQPNACPACGPRLTLEEADASPAGPPEGDPMDIARGLIGQGKIVAIKGIGGFHLACDAANPQAVERLRRRKRRYHKPFALMATDLDMIRRYARVGPQEEAMLRDKAAPIVILEAAGRALAPGVAPGQNTLGFMLPYTPLHHLLLRGARGPMVLTSGNRSDEPQCIDNDEARERLADIADYWLVHDREIANRLDDSVVRVAAGRPRLLRRARGYAPDPIALPDGFEAAPPILAMGGELKNTFCLLRQGHAVVSQHIGDLQEASALKDYARNLGSYRHLFDHRPELVAVDLHPDYLSTRLGRDQAQREGFPLAEIQHHHAHIASCMAEHGLPLDTGPVLGVALDGLGYGDDGGLWGGEFLLADYRGYRRLARFRPIPMLGGNRAAREPWRNTYAHLAASLGWELAAARYPELEIVQFLSRKPIDVLHRMFEQGLNSPPASSCGRLFDAVAAALGVCTEAASFEGQAAIELESLAAQAWEGTDGEAYPVEQTEESGMRVLAWGPMWRALLEDLRTGVPRQEVAARFHRGVASAVATTATRLCGREGVGAVALSGGVFQNRLLLEEVSGSLRKAGLEVLMPERLPANDGGISLGQAVIAAAQRLAGVWDQR